ncbi:uncharacterized protein LOC127844477 isoform X2 [Dreissena polymorpha]|uniref:uncharacterized protein LOC127844477 isoform X2 n=1 Tax=Dreissena polymorpha TaxID=45954 RepID=UPI002263DE1C|nr:uncharacterized protein LOC127844477 isoform X2 [Dreissena polymorpha]
MVLHARAFLAQLQSLASRPASAIADNDQHHFHSPRPSPRIRVHHPPDMERRRVAEIEGIDSSKMGHFPFSSFKLLGGLQIGIGAVCLILGIVDLLVFLYVSHFDNETLSALTIASVPIWCGLWFIVAGSMGGCMSLEQKTTLSYFKMTFMILSVLCALLFGPALFAIEVYMVVLRKEGNTISAAEWLIPMVIAFFALNEIIVAVITAAICCCCSPLKQAKVRVLYTGHLDEMGHHPEKHRLVTPEIFYTDSSRLERAQKSPAYAPRREQPQQQSYDAWEEDRAKSQPPRATLDVPQPRHVQAPRASIDDTDNGPLTHYSRPPTYEGNPQNNSINSYRRLRQLTIPGVGTA